MAQSGEPSVPEGASSAPRIMLSGFDMEAEKTYMINIIKRLGGIYLTNPSNPQEFLPSCSHVVCKKPNRNEKYLAGCASGKWIMTPYFLHRSESLGKWVQEEEDEWGVNLVQNYSTALQLAPKRWREQISLLKRDPPFVSWSVGLIMKQSLARAYQRIIEAGGGTARHITSWDNEQESPGPADKTMKEKPLTHILVTPNFVERVKQCRADNILCLGAEYLAAYLLHDPPANPEKYSIFRKKKASPRPALPKPTSSAGSQLSLRSSSRSSLSESSRKKFSSTSSVKSLESILKYPSTVKSKTYSSPLPGVPQRAPERSHPKPAVVISPSVVKVRPISGKPGAKGSTEDRSLFKVFAPDGQVISLTGGNLKKSAIQQRRKTQGNAALKLSQRRRHDDVTIKLSTRGGFVQPNKRPSSGKEVFKRHYPEEFLREHHTVLQEFASRKKRQNSPYGIVDYLYIRANPLNESIVHTNRDRYARPFSRDVIVSLEACLEVTYRNKYSNFLMEVSSRMDDITYPPSDVIYVIMKVILLDSEEATLAKLAFKVLQKIVTHHPPQSPVILATRLYHKALTLMTDPDDADSSPIMVAIGNMLSFSNNDDWALWCNQDPVLGAHWTFYSRVLNMAINPAQPRTGTANDTGVTNGRKYDQQKVENATLLTKFLTTLIEKDYEDVITRNNLPTNNPMIKCLISDLLWPYMTGLEPWFRRPSPNLADLVSLFVRAVNACVSYMDLEEIGSDDESDISSGSDDIANARSRAELNSRKVLDQIGRIISVTESWCVFCDSREKERGKRTATTRPFEYELVKALRAELEENRIDVIELALENLPARLRIKVSAALIEEACLDGLIADITQFGRELTLEIITSCHMQMIPGFVFGEGEESNEQEMTEKKSSETADVSTADDDKKSKSRATNKSNTSSSSSAKANKRNPKGETLLHLACMGNKPDAVRDLLCQPGIDPNLTDYAGWTALGEACNHGHIECVKALLELPVKPLDATEVDNSSELRIDITLCPKEGQTPLHDALGNNHLEIACLLLDKGGVGLLDKTDSDGRSPLDYCCSDASRAYMIKHACQAVKKGDKKKKSSANDQATVSKNPLMTLASEDRYNEILIDVKATASKAWRERVRYYVTMVHLLLSHYVTSGFLLRSTTKVQPADDVSDSGGKNYHITDDVIIIDDSDDDDDVTGGASRKKSNTSDSFNDVTPEEIQRYCNEVYFCTRWKECWALFQKHVQRLLRDDDVAFDDVMSDILSPIPTD